MEDNAKEEGKEEGRFEGALATIAAGAVMAAGVWVFNKAKENFIKRKHEKQLAPIVRQEFLNIVEQYKKVKLGRRKHL